MASVAQILTSVISLYSFLCVVRILMSWIPSLAYSPFGRLLSQICDPYLDVFSRWSWTHVAGIDFSPIFALGTLTVIEYTINGILTAGGVRLSIILFILLNTFWSLVTTILIFILLLLIVRFIMHLTRNDNSMIWNRFDAVASPALYSITRLFTFGRPVSFKIALIAGIITDILFYIAGGRVIEILQALIGKIPF